MDPSENRQRPGFRKMLPCGKVHIRNAAVFVFVYLTCSATPPQGCEGFGCSIEPPLPFLFYGIVGFLGSLAVISSWLLVYRFIGRTANGLSVQQHRQVKATEIGVGFYDKRKVC